MSEHEGSGLAVSKPQQPRHKLQGNYNAVKTIPGRLGGSGHSKPIITTIYDL